MRSIVLVSCVKLKLKHPAQVKDIYISDWFKSALKYAETLNPDLICVLSAKHGLLALNDEIAPYEITLNTMSRKEIKTWATVVTAKLALLSDLQQDRFVLLAGEKYRALLVPHLAHYEVPMQGLKFGQQLQFLKAQL